MIAFYSTHPGLFLTLIVLSVFTYFMIIRRQATIARMRRSHSFTNFVVVVYFAALMGVLWWL